MSYVRPNIDAMAGYTPGEQPQDGALIKLNTNENPYPPSPAVGKAIEETVLRLRKYPDPMANAFRRQAAELLGLEPDWILCGNGSDDILTIVTRAFVGEGELLRLPYPSYILYKTLAELQGARSEEVRFKPDWTLPEAFAAEREDLRLAFLANPNSPSGTMVPAEKVLEVAERLPCPLLVDEAYVDFAETNCASGIAVREDFGVAVAEQVVCVGRLAFWLRGGPTASDRTVNQGEGLVQLRRAVDRRGHRGGGRPGMAGLEPGEDSRHAGAAGAGNAEVRVCDD